MRAVVRQPRRSGWGAFCASDEWVTRLHESSRWSMRDTSASIPADCPQRNEHLSWTGNIQAFAPTAAFHYSTTAPRGRRSWLVDLSSEQEVHTTTSWHMPVIPSSI